MFESAIRWVKARLQYSWLAPRMGYYLPLLEHVGFFIIAVLVVLLLIVLSTFSGSRTLVASVIEIGSMVAVFAWPTIALARHCYLQDRLLDRMRASYAIGSAALAAENRHETDRNLRSIRACENRWKFGDSLLYRTAVYCYISGVNLIFAAAMFFAVQWRWMVDQSYGKPVMIEQVVKHFQSGSLWLFLPFGIVLFYGLMPVAGLHRHNLRSRRWVDFYGDRLEQMLRAGRGVEAAPQHEGSDPPPEWATARELLGLEQHFSKSDLRRAWIRLARELHPDRWSNAPEAVREYKEAALKRVNAARDELEAQAA